jgi:hypothetical protein
VFSFLEESPVFGLRSLIDGCKSFLLLEECDETRITSKIVKCLKTMIVMDYSVKIKG